MSEEKNLMLFGETEKKWYTIEELAELSGINVETLRKGESPLKKFGLDFKVESKIVNMGGHKNVKKYSESVLKALKQYQLKNSVPNAVKDKETAVIGNISFIQNQTIADILNNPKALTEFALAASQKLLENQPKVEWFDKVVNSDNLVEIGTVGKVTGIGSHKIFAILQADKVIYAKYDDGIKYFVPYAEYDRYFKSIPTPFLVDDKVKTRYKLMLTQEGMVWITKRYGKKEKDLAKQASRTLKNK